MPARKSINGATINGQPVAAFPPIPPIVPSDEQVVGSFLIDGMNYNDVQGTFKLTELRSAVKVEIPSATFDLADFPNASPDDTLGQPIPIAFGKVKGIKAFLVDRTTSEFKFLNHAVTNVTRYYNGDGTGFNPDSVDVSDSTFIYTDWDGQDNLFVDCDAGTANPVDMVKELLTDDVRGAELAESELDTTSTDGTGFGASGARLKYIAGTDSRTGDESYIFEMSMYIDDRRLVTDIIDGVKATAFGFVFVDLTGVWQYKAWEAAPSWDFAASEKIPEITDASVKGMIAPDVQTSDAITKVITSYAQNYANDSVKTVTVEDEELRQKRGLTKHSIMEATIPISNKSGALIFSQYRVQMRGKPRRLYNITATNQFKTTEAGDTLRINYTPLDLDFAVNVIEVTQIPGRIEVGIKAMDVFGFQNQPGFWSEASPAFPDELGGASITAWDDTWTEAQKKWARENIGFWLDGNGYADSTDDPEQSYFASIWS